MPSPIASRPKQKRSLRFVFVSLGLAISAITLAQSQPATKPVDDIHILTPTVDRANARVSISGNFWKEDVADWCETALSGRPSDFLHETLLCTTTTRALLEQAFRDAGFHDADAWVSSVRDFPRVRGDRFLILLDFTLDGKPQRYSLDEIISFQGWGISAGPHGFMFKGDPGKKDAVLTPAAPADEADRTKILRDDPQIAMTFRGLQNMSQSFADHPFCYDDWIYPMMNIGRNYSAVASKVLTANAQIPVTITFQKCTEEQFITESVKVWHDPAWVDLMTTRVNIARDIDKNKAELWAMEPDLHKLPPPNNGGDLKANMLIAHIELGYATLDATWAKFAAANAHFTTTEPDALAALKEHAARWSNHLLLKQKSAGARSRYADCELNSALLSQKPGPRTLEEQQQLQKYRGEQIEQLAAALDADNQQEAKYWEEEKSHLDPTDPRSAWLAAVSAHVELGAARTRSAAAGTLYGKALQATPTPDNLKILESDYSTTLTVCRIAETRIQLAENQFEITKREGFEADPDLPALRQKKQQLETQLQQLLAATRPAP